MASTNVPDTNLDALENLKPLVAPEAISWWPLAPGWWLVGILLLVALIALLVWGWKYWLYYRRTRYQREALQLLESLTTQAPEQRLPAIAVILRRAAIHAWGREQVGTKNWREIIDWSQIDSIRRGKKYQSVFDENSIQLLTDQLYRHTTPAPDALQNLQTQSALWLKTLPAVNG
jgi:hypothetical protein